MVLILVKDFVEPFYRDYRRKLSSKNALMHTVKIY